MANSDNKRILWIDVVRTIAISCVVLNHAVDEIFISFLYGNQFTDIAMTGFMYTSFTIGRLGVPLFLFISGMLLLKRTYVEDYKIEDFYRRNWGNLFRTTLIWIIINNIFTTIFCSQQFSVKNLVYELLFLKSGNMSHFWYMPVILGLYLAIPFISIVLHNIPKKYVIAVGSVAFLYQFVLPSFVTTINILGISKKCFGLLDVSFLGSCYGLYLVTGYYITNKKMTVNQQILSSSIFIVCIVISVVFQVTAFHIGMRYNVWYDFVFLYMAALAYIKLLSQIKITNTIVIRIVSYISRISLGIYFIHMPIKSILIKYLPFRKLPAMISLPMLFLFVYIASIAGVYALAKSKFLKNMYC